MAQYRTETASPAPAADLIWGLGLTDQDAKSITAHASPSCRLVTFDAAAVPPAREDGGEAPMLIWVEEATWRSMGTAQRQAYKEWEIPLRVLVVDENTRDENASADHGFMTTVRSPLDAATVRDVLRRAKEMSGLYADIIAMTKEILLERELMARKTEQLEFLNRILTRASESLDPKTILNRAREDISVVMPLRALMAAFWREGDQGLEVDLFLSPDLDPEEQGLWVEYMLEQVAANSHGRLGAREGVAGYDVTLLESESDLARIDLGPPSSRETVTLPLAATDENFGVLALARQPGLKLGKDQIESVHAAVAHISLALKNALLYCEAQFKAEYDGLTRIPNRQGFDRRLQEELARHARYGNKLSLLLIDLDHFKAVNDTYGHEAGDLVLREVGRLLSDSLRATDYPARFGGEEFAVILPHTPAHNAAHLAERLRETLEETIFHYQGLSFQVTSSIGVSSLPPGMDGSELVSHADRALYEAKDMGRNNVRLAGALDDGQDQDVLA